MMKGKMFLKVLLIAALVMGALAVKGGSGFGKATADAILAEPGGSGNGARDLSDVPADEQEDQKGNGLALTGVNADLSTDLTLAGIRVGGGVKPDLVLAKNGGFSAGGGKKHDAKQEPTCFGDKGNG